MDTASMLRLLLLTIVSCASASCPIWTFYNESEGDCKCGSHLDGLVNCKYNNGSLSLHVLSCNCMTYNQKIGQVTVGRCPFNCKLSESQQCPQMTEVDFNNYSDLDLHLCSWKNRTDHLCGNCIDGHGYPVYSYALYCVRCNATEFTYNLLKYIASAYVPLTVFYVILILFKISITSHKMSGFVFVSQALTIPSILKLIMLHNSRTSIMHYLLAIATLWNLDFLRSVIPPFCLHPKLNILHVVALEYVIAVYPMILIVITYFIVSLHDRYRLVVSIFRPLRKILSCLRKKWNIKGSLVQTFASFLVLSYVKILNTSFELLNPVSLQNMSGSSIDRKYLYVAGTVEYFGHDHLPFGILAIIVTIIFNILPVILLLFYPYAWFRRVIFCGKFKQSLVAFTDAFYGYYKVSHKCYLIFSTIYFVSLFVILSIFFMFKDYTFEFFTTLYLFFLGSTIVIVQPYKAKPWNKINFVLIVLGAVTYGVYVLKSYILVYEPNLYHLFTSLLLKTISFVICFILGFYGFTLIIFHFIIKVKQKICMKLKQNTELTDEAPLRIN